MCTSYILRNLGSLMCVGISKDGVICNFRDFDKFCQFNNSYKKHYCDYEFLIFFLLENKLRIKNLY